MSIEQVRASGASIKRREAGGCGTGFVFSLTSAGNEDNTCAGWEYIAFNRGGRTAKNIGEVEQKQQKDYSPKTHRADKLLLFGRYDFFSIYTICSVSRIPCAYILVSHSG